MRLWLKKNKYHLVWFFPIVGFVFGLTKSQNLTGGFVFAFGGFLLSLRIVAFGLRKNDRKPSPFGENVSFDSALIALIAAVVKADGSISAKEIELVDAKLKSEYTRRGYLDAAQKLKIELEKPQIIIEAHAAIIAVEFSASEKVQLLHLLVKIAVSDGILTISENTILQKITAAIGVPYRTLDSLLAMHRFRHEYQEHQYKQTKSVSNVSLLENAFKILEIPSSATNKEIKKAYKRLAVLHHPDKVAHLGEQAQKTASEKFKLIVGAYDILCKKRGII